MAWAPSTEAHKEFSNAVARDSGDKSDMILLIAPDRKFPDAPADETLPTSSWSNKQTRGVASKSDISISHNADIAA